MGNFSLVETRETGANRTKVGLKFGAVCRNAVAILRANRTKVGLKSRAGAGCMGARRGANRTKVGLKSSLRTRSSIPLNVLIEPRWD